MEYTAISKADEFEDFEFFENGIRYTKQKERNDMSDIELVIKIPEGLKMEFESESWTALSCMEMKNALKKATLLPKGHKRLIEDNFKSGPVFDKEGNRLGYRYVTQEDLNSAKTIIEEDKE